MPPKAKSGTSQINFKNPDGWLPCVLELSIHFADPATKVFRMDQLKPLLNTYIKERVKYQDSAKSPENTLSGTLSRMESAGLIVKLYRADRKKRGTYELIAKHEVDQTPHLESNGERMLWEAINGLGFEVISQYKDKHLMGDKSNLRIDFIVNLNGRAVVIEKDSLVHIRPVGFFGGEKQFVKTFRYDIAKDFFVMNKGWPMARILPRDAIRQADKKAVEIYLRAHSDCYIIQTEETEKSYKFALAMFFLSLGLKGVLNKGEPDDLFILEP